MQDVVAALVRKGMTFRDYLDPSREALLDAAHVVRVNYETYLFADPVSVTRFRGDVPRYCGLLTDPVGKRRFRPGAHSPRSEYDGVLYLFPSERERRVFEADPERYRMPNDVM